MSYTATPTDVSQWKTFYKNLKEEATIPSSPSATIDDHNAIFQEMYVDLSEVQSQLSKSPKKPVRTVIYCDVLNVPDSMTWTVSGNTLMIIARQIYWGKGSAINLDFRKDNVGALLIYAEEHVGTGIYRTESESDNNAVTVRTSDYKSKGYLIKLKKEYLIGEDGNAKGLKGVFVEKREMKYDQGIGNLVEDHFKLYLNDAFFYGSVLFNLNQEVALKINKWVTQWARESLGLSGLFYRSAASSALLQSRINAKSKGARFVPKLSKAIYEGLSSAFVAAAQQYENSYNQFIIGGKLTSQNLELAKTMKDNKQYESDYIQNLISQALENFQRARRTCLVAEYAFNAERLKADLIKIRFEKEGIPKYVRESIVSAVFGILMALATLVAAVAAMAAGVIDAAPAAAGGAVNAAENAAQTANSIDTQAIVREVEDANGTFAESIARVVQANQEAAAAAAAAAASPAGVAAAAAEAARKMSNLSKALKMLKTILESLQKSILASYTIFKKASSLTKGGPDTKATDEEYKDLQELLSAESTTTLSPSDAWDVFLIEFDLSMEYALKADEGKGIDFAAEYKAQIHKLAIFGKSLAKAQEGIILTSNQLSSLMLQQGLVQRQNERLEQYVNDLEIDEVQFIDMQQIFYSRLLDMKGNLFTSLQNYKDSYYFWALKESELNPSILSSIDEIGTGIGTLANIKRDEERAYNDFIRRPGDFRKEIKVDDKDTLDSLKENHSVTIPVLLENSVFNDLDRVRFDEIQVWLNGVSHGKEAITIDIITSGVFADRYEGTQMNFVSEPLIEKFQYKTKTVGVKTEYSTGGTTNAVIEREAKIADDMRFAYAMPTPFTEWTIDVHPDKNKHVNLDGLDAIVIVLKGTAI